MTIRGVDGHFKRLKIASNTSARSHAPCLSAHAIIATPRARLGHQWLAALRAQSRLALFAQLLEQFLVALMGPLFLARMFDVVKLVTEAIFFVHLFLCPALFCPAIFVPLLSYALA